MVGRTSRHNLQHETHHLHPSQYALAVPVSCQFYINNNAPFSAIHTFPSITLRSSISSICLHNHYGHYQKWRGRNVYTLNIQCPENIKILIYALYIARLGTWKQCKTIAKKLHLQGAGKKCQIAFLCRAFFARKFAL